jgi:hypothetical protein
MNFQATSFYTEACHQPLNLTIEFEDKQMAPQKEESALLACLRSKGDPLSNTQHTTSTLGSPFGPSEHDDDDQSLCSLDFFDEDLLDAFDDHGPEGVIDTALLISGEAVPVPVHESRKTFNSSWASFNGIEDEQEKKLNDSMSCLNDALQNLATCMARTEESQKMVLGEFSKISSLKKQGSQRSLNCQVPQRGLLSRQDSTKSLTSVGSSSFKGPKSFSKPRMPYKLKSSLKRDCFPSY